MNQPLAAFLLITGSALCLVALFLVLETLFPRLVARTHDAAEAMPGRAFLLGLVNFLFLFALLAVLSALGENLRIGALQLLALLVLALLLILLTFGLAGVAQLLGARLAPERGPLARTLWGAAALTLACLTPFLGWFGLLPYTALLGLGAFILSWFRRDLSKETDVIERI
jgi:hypothetical protein